MGVLVSVQVGMPRVHAMPADVGAGEAAGAARTWRSGIYKDAVRGPVRVTPMGIDGDAQADLKHHGGPDNVALAYAAERYGYWRRALERPALPYGAFGENFTIDGMNEESVCIGDIYRIGQGPDAVVMQVTQARQPCANLARRVGRMDMVKLVVDSGWGGWYMRVLRAGDVEAGMAAELIERPHAEWTALRAVRVMYERKTRTAEAAELAALPELSRRWKKELLE